MPIVRYGQRAWDSMHLAKDEDARKAEMAALEEERAKTEKLRAQREELAARRKQEIERRRREIGERKAKKLAESFLDGLGQDILGGEARPGQAEPQ